MGADGVQRHGAHVFFLSMFLSLVTNLRAEKWDGSGENKVRIVLEMVESVRLTTKLDRIGIKMNGYDM